MATYQSAKKSGFQGSYSDWVSAGRPDGGSNQSQEFSGSLGSITWTDHNNKKHTMDLGQLLNSEATKMQDYHFFGFATNATNNKFGGLPIDIFNSRREDQYWADGIDYSKFENPEQARAAIDAYTKSRQELANKSSQLAWQIRDRYGSFNRRDAKLEFSQSMKDFSTSEDFKNIASDLSKDLSEVIQQGQNEVTQPDGRFGLNPRNGEPLTQTQAYNLARQNNPGLKYSEFSANPQKHLEVAGIQVANADMTGGAMDRGVDMGRPGEGAISQQNRTGVPYPKWAELMRSQGKPASYQDWLTSDRGVEQEIKALVGTDTSEGVADPVTGTTTPSDPTKDALDNLEASPFFQGLPEDQKALLRMTVKSWNPEQEVNMDNVMKEFNNIKTNTIDPYFKEQVDVFTRDVQDQWSTLEKNRQMQLEQERALEGGNIRQAKSDLEARGMTFSGQGIEQLGDKAAYSQEGETGIPGQTPVGAEEDLTQKGGMTFKDGRFFEGSVNQANRLMASSSMKRYLDNVNRVGRSAENVLGANQAAGLIPGYSPAGVTTGSLEAQKQSQLADTLGQLAGQQRQNTQYQQPMDFSSFNSQFQ